MLLGQCKQSNTENHCFNEYGKPTLIAATYYEDHLNGDIENKIVRKGKFFDN